MSALSFGRGAWPGLGPELCPSEQTLELLALPCCLEELEAAARPSISDDLKIGYFVTDHATQTDITEVAELKELTNTTQTLVQLIDSLQQDFLIYKNVLCSQYEEKIQEHASNLCRHINDRLNDIEDFHKKREAQIRQSYQQQLSDALAVPRMDFEKHYFINEDTDSSVAEHMQVLMNKLLERDSKIQYLEAELQDYHEHECVKMIIFEDDDQEKKMLEKENEDFKQEVSRLYDMILHLENSLKLSEKENKKLDTKVRDMQLKMENDEKTVIKLITAHEEMKKELQNEKLLVKSLQFKEAKKDIETEVENKVTSTETKTAALQVEEKDTKQLKEVVESEHENIVSLEKKELQKREPQKGESQKGLISKKPKKTPSEKIIEKGDEKRALLAEIEKLRKSEGRERQHIESLKKEVEQVNRSWAKKFEILKKSLHAIKNEMFLRQSLQRQSASFNHATVSQTVAVPLCIETGSSEMKMDRGGLYVPSHLPQIPSQSSTERKEKKGGVTDVQITVGTEMYNLYEDVPGDRQGFAEAPPLPPPPPPSRGADRARPSGWPGALPVRAGLPQ